MKFLNQSFEEFFCKLFKDIAEKYKLKIEKVNDCTMHLRNDIFNLTFSYDMDTSWIYYTINDLHKSYLVSNYINVNAEEIDKEGLYVDDTISKNIERTMIIQSRVLKRKFKDLLLGNMNWFDKYKETQFCYETKLYQY